MIVMTHNFELDVRILQGLASFQFVRYIGLLGPEHRREGVLAELDSQTPGLSSMIRPRLSSPVGLPLGGRKPSEIALSIVSEIQAFDCRSSLVIKKHQKISVVVLAAGASSRLGHPKQLVSFQGETLLNRTVRMAHQVANAGVFVVLGAACEKIAETLSSGETIVFNKDWQSGLSTSVKQGFKAAIPNPKDALQHSVLFLLADQPLVEADHLQKLISTGREKQVDVVATEYPEVLGVPALFAAEVAPSIDKLEGDKGCRQIILSSKNKETVRSSSPNFDVDTRVDMEKLLDFQRSHSHC